MQIEFGLYDHFQVVNNSVLCSLPITLIKAFPIKILEGPIVDAEMDNATNNTSTTDDDTTIIDDDDLFVNDDAYVLSRCTNVSGRYHLSTFYYVPKIQDTNLHYTPDVRLSFTDIQGRKVGCTVSGPYSLFVENDTRSQHGYVALGISCCILIFVFAFLLVYSSSYGQKLLSRHSKNTADGKRQAINDDDDDDSEILQITRNAILAQRRRLQHLNQYQYFRTLPNGQVVPLPGLQAVPPYAPTVSTAIPKDATATPSQSAFTGLSPPHQNFYYYKSPRPVITVTRHIPKGTKAIATTTGIQQVTTGSAILSQNIPSPQYQVPAYLQNIPDSSSGDDDSQEEGDDDDDAGHHLTSNPRYNETHLPTRPVI
jgi:hypothetical protein